MRQDVRAVAAGRRRAPPLVGVRTPARRLPDGAAAVGKQALSVHSLDARPGNGRTRCTERKTSLAVRSWPLQERAVRTRRSTCRRQRRDIRRTPAALLGGRVRRRLRSLRRTVAESTRLSPRVMSVKASEMLAVLGNQLLGCAQHDLWRSAAHRTGFADGEAHRRSQDVVDLDPQVAVGVPAGLASHTETAALRHTLVCHHASVSLDAGPATPHMSLNGPASARVSKSTHPGHHAHHADRAHRPRHARLRRVT